VLANGRQNLGFELLKGVWIPEKTRDMDQNFGIAELRDEPWRDWDIAELEVVK